MGGTATKVGSAMRLASRPRSVPCGGRVRRGLPGSSLRSAGAFRLTRPRLAQLRHSQVRRNRLQKAPMSTVGDTVLPLKPADDDSRMAALTFGKVFDARF